MKNKKELHEERMKLWDASVDSHANWIDKHTGLFDTVYTEKRTCPVCNSAKQKDLFNKEGGTYVKCEKCTMVYLNPVFKDEILTNYYRQNHALQSETVESDIQFYSALYNKGLDMVSAHKETGRVLDIGCSTGIFLDICKQRNWATFGLELNEKEAVVAKTKHTLFQCDLDDLGKEFIFEL